MCNNCVDKEAPITRRVDLEYLIVTHSSDFHDEREINTSLRPVYISSMLFIGRDQHSLPIMMLRIHVPCPCEYITSSRKTISWMWVLIVSPPSTENKTIYYTGRYWSSYITLHCLLHTVHSSGDWTHKRYWPTEHIYTMLWTCSFKRTSLNYI